jgi:hypothetical protein
LKVLAYFRKQLQIKAGIVGVPLKAATMLSVAGWLAPMDRAALAVSITSTPASAAFRYAIEAIPLV